MYRLALTGRSGSGKGIVARMFWERGIPTLDTDALVHRFYEEKGSPLLSAMASRFGERILRDGIVDRAALRDIVFADPAALADLNRMVHREVAASVDLFLAEQETGGLFAAAVDAPQLFEAGLASCFDAVIAVVCPEELRVRRIMVRDGISEETARRRLSCQLSDEEYSRRSRFVLDNGVQPVLPLSQQIDEILTALSSDSRTKGTV